MIELARLDEPRGIHRNDPANLPGYVLFEPMISDTTYLIDRAGQVVHVWRNDHAPTSACLLADGHLLHGARLPDAPRFYGGGQGGRIEKLTWDGQLVWRFDLADETGLLHHDFEPLPNGNILTIAWEGKSRAQAISAGRAPENTPAAGIWPDVVMEIEPIAPAGGRVVWEWHSWDHLLQNRDPRRANYAEPSAQPRKIDINAGPPLTSVTTEQLAARKALGNIPTLASVDDFGADIFHSNAINYNAELDQIAISVRALSEIWIIDHATTSAQAAGAAGDLLYRWGNPATYGLATDANYRLGHQHDVRWIPAGFPGNGNLLVFSNDAGNGNPRQSEVVEFTPPVNQQGTYVSAPGRPFGPSKPAWTYTDRGFYSPFISSAQRLSNGNTMIAFGPQGRFVEVTADGEIVWEYWSPYSGEVRLPDGSLPQPGSPFMYAAFRATFVPADHPALAGRDLSPLDPQPAASILREAELAPFRRS